MAEIPNIPKISITEDNVDEVSDCQSDVDIKGIYTDIEDFDSNDEGSPQENTVKGLKKAVKKTSPAVTDIEDYNDSCSEEEKSDAIPEIKLCFHEFLEMGHTEETTHISNKITSKCDYKVKEGKFLPTLMVDEDPGCVTDCENYDTSGDERPDELTVNNIINTAYTPEHEDVNIRDECSKDDKNGQNAISDVEDEGACALCMCDTNTSNISETEDVYLSGEEEIIEFEASSSDDEFNHIYPALDTALLLEGQHKWVSSTPELVNSCNTERVEEPLTDIEKLNSSDSDASTESNHPVIPPTSTSMASLTDVEDLDLGEAADLLAEMQQIRDVSIPATVRQIVITKEDESGVPVTNVMPLQENIYLGIHNNYVDKGLTDTEDISCTEEDLCETNSNIVRDQIPNIIEDLVENANVQNCESIKSSSQRKIEYIEKEPVTDVEEIFLTGTVRRRKNKTKTQSKSKSKYLSVKSNAEQTVTDVEEIEISDFECPCKHSENSNQNNSSLLQARPVSPELKTDIEYISGEEGEASEDDQKSEIIVSGQENYVSTITTVETLMQQGVPVEKKLSSPILKVIEAEVESAGSNSQYTTDVEDVQLQSDVEENPLYETYSRANTISPGELQDILNDGGISVVHEKCGKTFNVEEEKHHIKGMNDCMEIHTDVEYLDEEIITDKTQPSKYKPEGGDASPEPKQNEPKK